MRSISHLEYFLDQDMIFVTKEELEKVNLEGLLKQEKNNLQTKEKAETFFIAISKFEEEQRQEFTYIFSAYVYLGEEIPVAYEKALKIVQKKYKKINFAHDLVIDEK